MQWSFSKRQQQQRNETIQKVQSIVDVIKVNEGEHTVLSAGKLLKYGKALGMTRAVLYKEHTLGLWNPRLWERRYGRKNKNNRFYDKELQKLELENDSLANKLEDAQAKIKRLSNELVKEKEKTKQYQLILQDQALVNAKQLGVIAQLQDALAERGVKFEINKDILQQ